MSFAGGFHDHSLRSVPSTLIWINRLPRESALLKEQTAISEVNDRIWNHRGDKSTDMSEGEVGH